MWNVITVHLDSLQSNIDIQEAIHSELEEYKKLNDIKIVKFLMNLTN